MRNIKFAGIHFRKDNSSAIAKITITNDTQSEVVLTKYVDLYQPDKDYVLGDFEDFIFWAKLDPAVDDYTINVEHALVHNINANTPYHVIIEKFMLSEELNTAELNSTIEFWHEDHGIVFSYLGNEGTTNIESYKSFIADGIEDTFVLDGTNRAGEFLYFTLNDATYYPSHYSIDWGSNDPDYNDETIDSESYFGIKFEVPPDDGDEIKIYFKPKINKVKISRIIKQPYDGSYIDYSLNPRIMSDALEIIE